MSRAGAKTSTERPEKNRARSTPSEAANGGYPEVRGRIRQLVTRLIPAGSTVVVVSKGDEGLLSLDGREGWHFPRTGTGQYAGHYPADATAAIEHLEELRAKGGDYFLVPSTYFWWFDHYPEFAKHLHSRYQLVGRDPDTCAIFALRGSHDQDRSSRPPSGSRPGSRLAPPLRALIESLVSEDEEVLVVTGGDAALRELGPAVGEFPRGAAGRAAPLDPDNGASAVRQLEELREGGARYVVFPKSAFWWPEQCRELRDYLERQCRLVAYRRRVGALFELWPAERPGAPPLLAVDRLVHQQTSAGGPEPVPAPPGVLGSLLRRLTGPDANGERDG